LELLRDKRTSAETQFRAKDILARLAGTLRDAETLRRLRAILVLERIGTTSAQEELEYMSKAVRLVNNDGE
jgi:hypothetical protein